MHLKALTLKGFKSFASPTTLHFEPGITCVVGPNGSGKSNVVDALAWVMGEQGAKSLRGGKMEDVIFAGTSTRPPLGRAEVSLTIDNTDGALPIDYAEVTLTRLMFRNGGSEYAINGSPARLLDVQELLSDSGVGRQMHVIVGQGQLDAVLAGSPAERRGFIEEAAGVLKHRKRKEKALRKLEATAANLTRLSDLLTELRRQLRPLGRQAEAARRAGQVQAELRDASARLLADDLATLSDALRQLDDRVASAVAHRDALTAQAGETAGRIQTLTARAEQAAPAAARAQETWYRLSAARERLTGLARLAEERMRHAATESEAGELDGPDEQAAEQVAAAQAEQAACDRALAEAREAAAEARAQREAAEAVAAAEEARVARAAREHAARREAQARLTGAVSARRTALARARQDAEQAAGHAAAAARRLAAAEAERVALSEQLAGLDAGEAGLDEAYEQAVARAREEHAALGRIIEALREAGQEEAALRARLEALQLSLARGDADRVLLDGPAPGVLGALAEVVHVRPGYEAALTAALGPWTEAVVVDALPAALDALHAVRAADAGRARLLIAGAGASGGSDDAAASGGPLRLIDLIDAPGTVRDALTALLGDVIVLDDLDVAASVLADGFAGRVVTPTGDLLARTHADGGTEAGQGVLAARAAADETSTRLQTVAARIDRLRADREQHERAVALADGRVGEALEALNASDARMSALAEQLGARTAAVRAAAAEQERAAARVREAEEVAAAEQAALRELEAQLTAAAEPQAQAAPGVEVRDRLVARAEAMRAAETEARLRVRTLEERSAGAASRTAALLSAARAREERVARAAQRRVRAARAARTAHSVRACVDLLLPHLDQAAARAAEQRAEAATTQAAAERELAGLRATAREQAAALDALAEQVHQAEVERVGLAARRDALIGRAVEEFGVDPDTLLAEYGPHVPILEPTGDDDASGDPSADGGDGGPADAPSRTRPFVRAEQEQRARAAERALAQLGTVNPLALEEYAAVQERTRFLTEQMEDLRATRRGLLDIVDEVDARVQRAFLEAFEDTDRAFRVVFARLFPGGEGRLVLTDPDDLVGTGVDVEARPAGKRLRRLSLLSGGERSLTALALLLAIFTARPSPFYVLDEVEAALDDTNLGRLLGLLEQLRASSQLIIVTHQKRTMEIADALYGVAMRGDGITTVISQRLRDAQSA